MQLHKIVRRKVRGPWGGVSNEALGKRPSVANSDQGKSFRGKRGYPWRLWVPENKTLWPTLPTMSSGPPYLGGKFLRQVQCGEEAPAGRERHGAVAGCGHGDL